MNYNLLEEKWLPVLCKNGTADRVGIIDSLAQAHRIRQIAASNPMDRVAVLRFLLALLYWCRGNPPDKLPDASFPPDWFEKLHDNKQSFNLLGDGKRFYQCKPASGNEGKLSANYLLQEIPTGTNISHFKHSKDGIDGLCRACCVLGLLRLPAFTTKGGAGKSPGINGRPPVYVIPLGSSLAETLWLSWRQSPSRNLGTPTWEKPELPLPKTGEVPLLTGLTWLPRRVWLDDPEGPEACCISCGRKEPLIRQCVFAGIGSAKSEGVRVWEDPHVIPGKKDVVKPGNALGAMDASAGQWTRIMAGVLRGQKVPEKCKLWVVGFDTKDNKYFETMEYEILYSNAPDYQEIQENIEKIEKWQREGSNLIRKMPIIASIRPHVERRVSAKAGELITGDEEAWERAACEYSPMMAAVANSLSPGYTTAALQKRKEIAAAKPRMGPKDLTVKKVRPEKKGGDK